MIVKQKKKKNYRDSTIVPSVHGLRKVFALGQKYNTYATINRGFKFKQYWKDRIISHDNKFWWAEWQSIEKKSYT